MPETSGYHAVAVALTSLRVERSTAVVATDAAFWQRGEAVEREWPGADESPPDQDAPAIACSRAILRISAGTRFDASNASDWSATIAAGFAKSVSLGASIMLLPLRTLGVSDLAGAMAWGFQSRKLIFALRRAAEDAGITIALTAGAGDAAAAIAIHDWCELVDRFNSPAIGMSLDLRSGLLDTGHAVEAIHTFGGRVRYVYADAAMNAEQAEQILRALAVIRFTGLCVAPAPHDSAWLRAADAVNARLPSAASSAPTAEASHAD
ncbi:MAG: hypothetical protein ACKVS9_09535 [Phycisphaerae bacterium]